MNPSSKTTTTFSTASGKNEIMSPIPSGVARMTPYMICWFLGLNCLYFFLVYYFQDSSNILWLPPPSPQACHHHSGVVHPNNGRVICSRSDLFAFEVTCFVALAVCGCVGFWTWHVSRKVHTAVPNTPAGRLMGHLPPAEFLAATNFTFQVWDFLISLYIPEYSEKQIMLVHHVMAAAVSWCSLRYTYLHYYGVFFLGLSEVSSIFLVAIGLSKHFPPEPNTLYQTLVTVVGGPMFAVTFVYYRVILWWPTSWQLFCDVFHVIESGQAAKLRPQKAWVLYLFLGLNIPLGFLQLYWATLILKEALAIIS